MAESCNESTNLYPFFTAALRKIGHKIPTSRFKTDALRLFIMNW